MMELKGFANLMTIRLSLEGLEWSPSFLLNIFSLDERLVKEVFMADIHLIAFKIFLGRNGFPTAPNP
jgi:hypothetical protein